jgi:hypothetical protein
MASGRAVSSTGSLGRTSERYLFFEKLVAEVVWHASLFIGNRANDGAAGDARGDSAWSA